MIIIKRLIFTENASRLLEQHNKYTFEVDSYLTKIQIRWIVEKIFAVPIRRVNTLRRPPTINRIGNFNSVCRKRAVISVDKGKKIRLTLSKNESSLFWIYKSWYSSRCF
jgi:ribosomal protein L23